MQFKSFSLSRTRRVILVLVTAAIVVGVASTIVEQASAMPAAQFSNGLSGWAHWGLQSTRFAGSPIAKPVYVKCYASDRAFDGAYSWRFGEPSGAIAYAVPKSKTVYMRPADCKAAFGFVGAFDSGRLPTRQEVFAFSSLMHESLHVQGVRNERQTECLANSSVKRLSTLLGASNLQASRLMQTAFDMSAKYVAASYFTPSGTCYQQQLQHDWTEYVVA